MSTYAKIKKLVKDKKAMSGTYKGKVRHLWPMVIGKSDKTGPGTDKEPIVLGYQFFKQNSDASFEPDWRCFKVDSFANDVAELLNPTTPRPDELTAKEMKRQNAVQEPDNSL